LRILIKHRQLAKVRTKWLESLWNRFLFTVAETCFTIFCQLAANSPFDCEVYSVDERQ